MINTLPNSNSTKILYFLMKMAKVSVQFYNGVEHLIDVDTPVLRHSNKNVLKKLEYFDILDEVRFNLIFYFERLRAILGEKRARFPQLLDMSQLNVDIICGSDVAKAMPINSIIMYTRIDDIGVSFEN